MLDGIGALVLDRIGGSRTVPTRHQPGGRLELHCTAVGKVLLAFADDQLVEQALQMLTPVTPYTVTDPRAMRAQLAEIRRTRVAPSRQEHRLQTAGIAVPVFGGGHVIAAVGIVAPLDAHMGKTVEPLQRCAAAIGASITERERQLSDE